VTPTSSPQEQLTPPRVLGLKAEMVRTAVRDCTTKGQLPADSAARRSEILRSAMPEMPANGGLSRIGGRSPDSVFVRFSSKTADRLRRIFEIFPFSGNSDRVTEFDLHCVAELAV